MRAAGVGLPLEQSEPPPLRIIALLHRASDVERVGVAPVSVMISVDRPADQFNHIVSSTICAGGDLHEEANINPDIRKCSNGNIASASVSRPFNSPRRRFRPKPSVALIDRRSTVINKSRAANLRVRIHTERTIRSAPRFAGSIRRPFETFAGRELIRRCNGGHHRARPVWYPCVIAPRRAPVDGMVIRPRPGALLTV